MNSVMKLATHQTIKNKLIFGLSKTTQKTKSMTTAPPHPPIKSTNTFHLVVLGPRHTREAVGMIIYHLCYRPVSITHDGLKI